jgi:hypothetical protein
MSYRITHTYNWYKTDDEKYIIKTYHLNHVPFTFDEIPQIMQDDLEIIHEANHQLIMTPEKFFQYSFYLIDEEAHPCLFLLDIENPEDMPPDMEYGSSGEDLVS